MKITHVIDTVETGGKLRVLVELVEGLRERGVRSTVLCFEDRAPAAAHLAERDIPLRIIGFRGRSARFRPVKLQLVRSMFRLRHSLSGEDADLVHAHLHVLDPLVYAPRRPEPIVATIHGFHPDWARAGRSGRALRTWLERCGTRRHGLRFVAVSSRVADALRSAWRLPPSTLRVIPNGIDVDTWPDTRPREDVVDAARIAMLGRLAPEKDLTTALEAFRHLLRDAPLARLSLAGEGPERAKIEARVRELGMAERVRLLGKTAEVGELLASSDLVWITSRREGLPIVALEAMASGVPVVATHWPGVEEVLQDRSTARIVPVADPKELARVSAELLGDAPQRQALSERARAYVRAHHARSTFVDSYLRAYRDALEGRW